MAAAPPLLRSPPFPWVSADVAAVSTRPSAAGCSTGPVNADLLDAIRTARVGGTFWAPPPALLPAAPIAVRADSATDITSALSRFSSPHERARMLVLLPAERWASRAAATCRRRGIAVEIGVVDPWAVLLEPGCMLVAQPGDEWRAIAAITGAPCLSFAGALLPAADLDAALNDGIGYRDCYDDRAVDAGHAVGQLRLWRAIIDANRRIAAVAGISWWKRERIGHFLWAGRRVPLAFVQTADAAVRAARPGGGGIAFWPSRMPAGLFEIAAAADVPILRIEDGFVRSIGLGTNFHLPSSTVLDASGIYFDPRAPSDLEQIYATATFTPELIARAKALAERIVAGRIGKYGRGHAEAHLPPRTAKRLVLVAGQVEDDLSVAAGGAGISSNLELLRRARTAEPDAELWFRPHPDVDSGHRRGAIPDDVALTLADRVVREGSAADAVEAADAVHVLTSLLGFEALLRQKEIVVHGQPFYAGWGLTRDLAPSLERRGRALSLPELVVGALILYPRYLDPLTGLPCPPEVVLDRFALRTKPKLTALTAIRTAQGQIVKWFGMRAERRQAKR